MITKMMNREAPVISIREMLMPTKTGGAKRSGCPPGLLRGQKRRAAIGLALTTIVAIAWVMSSSRYVIWSHYIDEESAYVGKIKIHGGLIKAWTQDGVVAHHLEVGSSKRSLGFELPRVRRWVGTRHSLLVIPLWCLLAATGIPAAWYVRKCRVPKDHCPNCGYDLCRNVSGTCPECGVPMLETLTEE